MLSNPEISVVIPVRNGMPYLPAAIESVLENSLDGLNLEIVISDNYSTDETSDYLSRLTDPRITLVRPPRPLSAAGNWTFVTQRANAPLVKLLCADDVLYQGGLQNQVRIMSEHPECILVSSNRSVIDRSGKKLIRSMSRPLAPGVHEAREVLNRIWLDARNHIGEPSAVTFRRDPLLQALPWDETIPYVLDLELYVRLLSQGSIFISNRLDSGFRVHPSGWSSKIAKDQDEQFFEFYKKVSPGFYGKSNFTKLRTIRVWLLSKMQMRLRNSLYLYIKITDRNSQ
jgi:glycosyltransferase involved in cell wall biosynthesis